ncbi:MAG: NAD(P)H-dependent oxidoreductase [Rhodobacter sp.]|nr:NAD(P)H-dependent oxidoreductase [Rhodobacter sp.]
MIQHRLLGICGSLRAPSVNRKLLNEAIRLYGPADVQIADLRLPLYDGDLQDAEGIPQAVEALSAQIADADAVLIATPEYNKAITGVLKNALDWVSRTDANPWKAKLVAIVSASAGRTGGEAGQYSVIHALAAFRPRMSSGPMLTVGEGYKQFDEDGRLINERYVDKLTQVVETLRAEVDDARKS